ncbi:DUF192 domain-containing protein [Candidatus Gottesmanbacteria bacterium]|nr:DUF192 domain-containing protein [Candidatus Gottesmanbacteria bacterium]
MKWLQKIPVAVLILTVCVIGVNIYVNRGLPTAKIVIKGTRIPVELAVTGKEKERGLSGRKELKPGTGLLFLYDHKEVFPFWMKEMQFPLDFVWIDGNMVIDLTENVPVPDGNNLHIIHPRSAVDKILELNVGDIQSIGIQVGDKVTFVDR